MDKAALYLRLSKEDVDKINKGDDSESIVNQRLLLTDYAIAHDFQIVDIYSDDDYSGLYDDRPEFDRLIKDSKLGKFDVVIAKSQSRFTRNMEHMEKYLHHDFQLLGIRFIGVVDGVDTQNMANKKSRQINGLVNEWYCEDLSNNIRAVFRQKMKAGQFLGGFAPYGYLKDPNDKHKFIVDEYAANVVKRIYALFLEGYSDRSICHILEDDEIPNPTLYKERMGLSYKNAKAEDFSSKYGLWSTTTVKRILTNETYLGKLIQGAYTKMSYKDKKIVSVPKEKWIVIDQHHEPIIDDETFYKVANMRKHRRICNKNQEQGKKVHMFAGKVFCATCGHTMIKSGGVRGRNDDWYMRCQLANKSRNKECTSHNIRYSAIQEIVQARITEIVNSIIANEDNVKVLSSLLADEDLIDNISKKEKELKNTEQAMESIAKSVSSLYLDRVNNQIDDDMFFGIKSDFEKKLAVLKDKKEKIREEIKFIENRKKSKRDIKDIVKCYTDYTHLTHEIVNDFIDYIEIEEKDKENQKQSIIIHWNF